MAVEYVKEADGIRIVQLVYIPRKWLEHSKTGFQIEASERQS